MNVTRNPKFWVLFAAIALVTSYVMLVHFRFSSNCCGGKLDANKIEQYEQKAKAGDASALASIQLHYLQNSDKENLKKWLIIGVNENDTESINQFFSFVALGQLALDGKSEGDWLRDKITMVATKGNPEAATMLGDEYLKGSILSKDVAAGKFWLRQASARNEHAAIQHLVKLLIEKPTTPSDRVEAIQLSETLYKISQPGSAYSEFARSTLEELTSKRLP